MPKRYRLYAIFAVAAVAALASGCAGQHYFVRALPWRARAILQDAPAVYAPEGVVAVSRGETARMRARFESSLDIAVRPNMRVDAALDLAAAVLAETYSETMNEPSRSLQQWTLWKAGVTGAGCQRRANFSIWGSESRRSQNMDDATKLWARIPVVEGPTAYGLARFTEGDVTSQAMLYCEAPIAVEPFPKTYSPGAPVTIHFRALDESSHFVFVADGESDAVVEKDLRPQADGSYVVEHTAPTQPGRYFVEVRALYPRTAHGNAAPRTVLWVPIYVDAREPSEPDAFMRAKPVKPADASKWAARVLELFNAERVKAGQPPLAEDVTLHKFAEVRTTMLVKLSDDGGFGRKLAGSVKGGDAVWDFAEVMDTQDSPEEHVQLAMLHPSIKKLIRSPKLVIGIDAKPTKPSEDAPRTQVMLELLWAPGASPKAAAGVVAEAPREVTRSPAGDQFLVVPLRVFTMRSAKVAALDTSPSLDARIRPMIDKVNRVWSAAGIVFRLDEVRAVEANTELVVPALAALSPAERLVPPNRTLTSAIPPDTQKGFGFRIYMIHEFDLNGMFIGRGDLFVKETASNRAVGGGIDEAVPRTMSHELGHALGLWHRQDEVGLMSWGTSGIRLTEAEVARARAVALSLAGTETLDGLKSRDPQLAAAFMQLADRDVSRWVP